VRGSGAGWVMTDDEWRDEKRMLERVLALLGSAQFAARNAASDAARAMPHASLRAMTDATFACYDAAVASAHRDSAQSVVPPFPATRVRDALGYRPWLPPPPDPPAVASPRGVGAWIAHAAVGLRTRLPGRILYRLAPAALVERLKRRLG
jgi:hypothetical protein